MNKLQTFISFILIVIFALQANIANEDPNHSSQSFYQAVVLFYKISVAEGTPLFINSTRQHLNKAIGYYEKAESYEGTIRSHKMPPYSPRIFR